MFTPTRLVAALAATGALGLAAAPALAHAPVKSRTPGPGSTKRDVKRIAITFGEAVLAGKISVTKDGKAVRTSRSGLNAKKNVLSASFAKRLAAGRYTVSWRVRADDGDSETGNWTFTAR